MTWLEYLPAKFVVFSVCYLGGGCTGCHFFYLLYFFIFFHGTEYCKIDANRHQFLATARKSGKKLLAGVGGKWCQMWCQKALKSHPFSNIKPVGGLETVERVDVCAYVAFYCTTAVAFERCTAVLTSRLLSHISPKKSSDFFLFF